MHLRTIAAILLLTAATVAAEPDEKALDWLRKAQQTAGGAERLSEIRDVEIQRNVQSTGLLQGLSGTQTVQYVLPDTLKQTNALDFGRLVVYVSGETGWIDGMQGFMPMPPPQLQQARGEIFRVREALLLADRDETRIVRFIGEGQQDGRRAAELEIAERDGDRSVRIWIDAETGDLFRAAYDGIAVQGAPPKIAEVYSDFRTVEGVRLPFRTAISQAGRLMTTGVVLEVKWNQGLTPEALGER